MQILGSLMFLIGGYFAVERLFPSTLRIYVEHFLKDKFLSDEEEFFSRYGTVRFPRTLLLFLASMTIAISTSSSLIGRSLPTFIIAILILIWLFAVVWDVIVCSRTTVG